MVAPMQKSLIRPSGRAYNDLRPLKVTFDVFGYSASSVLFEMGETKVLCAVTLQQGVPPFLKGSSTGWLNAEYSMLPTSTTIRTQREASTMKKNGRSVEISRLISRSLRSIVDLSLLGERTITIDCDVLQADGGTRTACITASYAALELAVARWVAHKEIPVSILKDGIAAISAGIYEGHALIDPDFAEDSAIDADFNFVLTKSGNVIEVQGTAEKAPISWEQFEQLRVLALAGSQKLFAYFQAQEKPVMSSNAFQATQQTQNTGKNKKNNGAPLFSLMNRSQMSS